MSRTISVKALDRDGNVKYAWEATLLAHEREENLIVLYGAWGRPLSYGAQGRTVPITNRSLEFYWLRQPYTLSAACDREGNLREYYGRIIHPPELEEETQVLTFILLGVDLRVTPDYDFEVLEHEHREQLSDAEDEAAGRALLALVEMVERREGPFDGAYLERYWNSAPGD